MSINMSIATTDTRTETSEEELKWYSRDGALRYLFADPPDHVNVGPFTVPHVSEYVRGNTVARDNIPVILYDSRYKMIDNEEVFQEKYAVMVPPTKEVGIVCAGCFDNKMSLWNNSRCVSCRTFMNHLDMVTKDKSGNPIPIENQKRKSECLHAGCPERGLEAVMERVKDEPVPVKDEELDLSEVATCDLIAEVELRSEHGLADYLGHVSVDKIIEHLRHREPKILLKLPCEPGEPNVVGASFEALEAEMRRVCYGTDVTKKRFYCDITKRRREDPHFTDPPVVTWEYVSDRIYKKRKY